MSKNTISKTPHEIYSGKRAECIGNTVVIEGVLLASCMRQETAKYLCDSMNELIALKARVAELEALSADSLLSHFPGHHLQIDLYPSGGMIEATGCEECGCSDTNYETVSWKTKLGQSFGWAVEKLKAKIAEKDLTNAN